MIHVTCAVHVLRRVEEEVTSKFNAMDKVISSIKTAPSCLLVFKAEISNMANIVAIITKC